MQWKCIYCPLHLSQIPFRTKLAFSATKPSGRLICGIFCSVRHMVSPQLVQWKWRCRSLSNSQLQPSSHSAYFIRPEPSSIWWTTRFCSKVFKVLKRVVLSALSKAFSISVNEAAVSFSAKYLYINNRIAVGRTPLSVSRCSISFIVLIVFNGRVLPIRPFLVPPSNSRRCYRRIAYSSFVRSKNQWQSIPHPSYLSWLQ